MKILVIDDHRLFAEAIGSALLEHNFQFLGVAANAADGEELVRSRGPDIVLVDIGLPDRDGLELGKDILRLRPETKLIALTALEDRRMVDKALAMGFQGYLTKDTNVSQFVAAVRAVAAGQVVLPQRLMRRSAKRPEEDWGPELMASQLTPREREVLQLLAQAATSNEIARYLSISVNTVRTHIQSILSKLQVHSRLEAASFAVRHGFVEVPGPHWRRESVPVADSAPAS